MMDANLLFTEGMFRRSLTALRRLNNRCEWYERNEMQEELYGSFLVELKEEIDLAIDRLDCMTQQQDIISFAAMSELIGSAVLTADVFGEDVFWAEYP